VGSLAVVAVTVEAEAAWVMGVGGSAGRNQCNRYPDRNLRILTPDHHLGICHRHLIKKRSKNCRRKLEAVVA
jgi:hypothetical protein